MRVMMMHVLISMLKEKLTVLVLHNLLRITLPALAYLISLTKKFQFVICLL